MAAARSPRADRIRRSARQWRDRLATLLQPQRSPVLRLLEDEPLTVDDLLRGADQKSIFRGRSTSADPGPDGGLSRRSR